MKTVLGFWENTPMLQEAAAALPWQRWREHEVLESETQGYSIYSCINHTTPLWKEYYILSKHDENKYGIFSASTLVQWIQKLPTELREENQLYDVWLTKTSVLWN